MVVQRVRVWCEAHTTKKPNIPPEPIGETFGVVGSGLAHRYEGEDVMASS
ncbi:MAG: hypothetical protein Fur005_30910 [Roseiflexaceae bacterium]